ncbi:MAG: TonB-dependent receptor domain-containing protein, partial [Longimicrobiaceae bacterium]
DGILRNAFRGRPGLSAPWKEGWRGLSPEIANEYDNQTQTERTTIGLTANFTPFSWFQNRLTLGLDKNDRLNRLFYTIDRTGRQPWGATNAPGAMYRYLPVTHVWTVDYAGTITNQFTPDISSSSSAGMQLNSRRFEAHETIGQGLVANRLNLISAAATTRASQEFEEQTSLGFFVQEQIGWRNRLFGTVAVRVDDNSAFGQEFSVVVYPKASLSYVISDEPFFNFRGVESLRLRTAWGRAGNAPAPFSADRTFAAAVTTVGDVSVNQLQAASYGNPNLKAETGEELELGFDASLFAGRLGLEFTYYNQRTKDALVSVPNPPSTGFGSGGPTDYCCSHFINVGEIANSGFELLLTGTPLSLRDVGWETTLSLATNRNQLVSFGGAREEITFGAFASVQRHREGYPLGGFWAVDVQRDAQGQPILQNGNVVVDFDNEIFMGSMLPTREIGLTNTLTLFGNLRLFANVDYKGGNYQWCAICSVRNRIDLNTWEVNNPSADPVDVLVWRSLQTLTHIMPADFLKLREVSVTYTLPTAWSQAFRSERASLSLSGRNLWMWTRYEGSSDPEVTFYSTSNFTHLDYASTPMTRRMVASLRLAF